MTQSTFEQITINRLDDSSDSDEAQTRLMVVDAHPLVRWAIRQITGERGDLRTVGEASTSAEAINLAFAVHPDVVTIDTSLPDAEGWELAVRFRQEYPELGIVILAADCSDEHLFRALDLGASAFVSKSAPIADVVSAIRHAAAAPSAFTSSGLAAALRRRSESIPR